MANEATDLLRRAAGELQRLTDNTKPEQLEDPTLCTEWKVRDLLNHLVGGATMFAISAEEGDIADDVVGQLMGTDQIGDDYKVAVVQATTRALAAFDQPGALEKMVKLPFGTMPGGVALQIAVFDVTTHCCDLARATAQQVDDEALLEAALAGGRQMIGAEMRSSGLFDAEQPEPANGSAADRLLAFAGRRLP
jgi:uncharacterized protein (TIGR03086 family)